jgi:large subunit ribosomal protein L17
MRHQRKRHKLSRTASHRKALLRNLCKEVIDHERIQTTEAKAKAVRPEVEKLITLAKRGDLHARRQALSQLGQTSSWSTSCSRRSRRATSTAPAATPEF